MLSQGNQNIITLNYLADEIEHRRLNVPHYNDGAFSD